MANIHTTLESLFQDIADKLRAKELASGGIVADTFPDVIENVPSLSLIGGKYPVRINNFYRADIPPIPFTPTVMESYGGYVWIAGNDSAGDAYFGYFSTLTNGWPSINYCKVADNRKYPVRAIGFAGRNLEYLYIYTDSNAYNNRRIIRISNPVDINIANYNYFTEATYSYTDATSHDGSIWAMTGTKRTSYVLQSNQTTVGYSDHSSLSHNYSKCCMYNSYPIAISTDGYYTYKSSITSTTVAGEWQIASGITCHDVAQIGDRLCVLCTREGSGTYLYHTGGTPGSFMWSYRMISNSTTPPIGITYANGLTIVAYIENGHVRFWASSDITSSGTNIHNDNLTSGFNGIALASLNNNAFMIANDGNTSFFCYETPSE